MTGDFKIRFRTEQRDSLILALDRTNEELAYLGHVPLSLVATLNGTGEYDENLAYGEPAEGRILQNGQVPDEQTQLVFIRAFMRALTEERDGMLNKRVQY